VETLAVGEPELDLLGFVHGLRDARPATPARDYRTQGHPLASRPGAQGRLRPEHRKRRGSTSLRDGRAVTVSDEVSAEREANCPPIGKRCPCTRTFRCPLSARQVIDQDRPADPGLLAQQPGAGELVLEGVMVADVLTGVRLAGADERPGRFRVAAGRGVKQRTLCGAVRSSEGTEFHHQRRGLPQAGKSLGASALRLAVPRPEPRRPAGRLPCRARAAPGPR